MRFPANGIDVSHHNVDARGREIDWAAVRAAGFGFAFVKASDGATYRDPEFVRSVEGAREAGVLVGAYHFLRAGSQAAAQAESFLSQIERAGGAELFELGAAVDVEDPDDDRGAWERIDRATRAAKVRRWLAEVRGVFPVPLIYCIPRWWGGTIGDDPEFGAYPLWAASPGREPRLAGSPWRTYTLWQHSFTGTVPGIGVARVDLNRPHPSLLAPEA